MEETGANKGYGKRPMWQWVVLYLVIGAIVYGAIYYLFLAKKGGYNYNQSSGQYSTQPTTATSPSDASPAPSDTRETANWKTYINTEYGYSFKYPPKLTSIERSLVKGDTVVSIAGRPEGSTDEGYYTGFFSISSFASVDLLYKSDEIAKELLNLQVGDHHQPPDRMIGSIIRTYPTYKRLSDAVIGGLEAKVFENKNIDGGIGKTFYLNQDDKMYKIVSNFYSSQAQYYPQELYDQILSTFRFD